MTVVDMFVNKLYNLMLACKYELLRFNLRLVNHYLLGTSQHIEPSISRSLINKIRVTLSWVDNTTLGMNYWDLFMNFDAYLEMFFPVEYYRIVNGPVFVRP